MADQVVVDGNKLMGVVFTVSGGVYGMVKDKVSDLYTSGVLQGSLPKGAVVTGIAFDLANDAGNNRGQIPINNGCTSTHRKSPRRRHRVVRLG